MGFQGSGKSKMLGSRGISRHKRPKSDSFPGERRVEEEGLSSFLEALSCMKHLKDSVKTKNRQSSTASTEVQSSLKQRISELEKRLQDQVEVRHAIEIALGYRTWSHCDAGVPISKAYLAYGIPQNRVKGLFLLLRAAYNIGGHTISADTKQSSILGCCISRPGQWLRLLLSSRAKFKPGDKKQAYAIEQSEPLLHFALCSGNHSDPAVRAYTPKRVFQELETAKEEYIRATFGVRNKKILLPKIVESFAKDSSLCPSGLMEMVQQSLPKSLGCSIRKYQQGKSRKSIEWIPHNFNFRYLYLKN